MSRRPVPRVERVLEDVPRGGPTRPKVEIGAIVLGRPKPQLKRRWGALVLPRSPPGPFGAVACGEDETTSRVRLQQERQVVNRRAIKHRIDVIVEAEALHTRV